MKKKYADEVALKRAKLRYRQGLRSITGAPNGHPIGPMLVYQGMDVMDGAVWLRELEEQADVYFGTSKGSVNVGPLETVPDAPLDRP